MKTFFFALLALTALLAGCVQADSCNCCGTDIDNFSCDATLDCPQICRGLGCTSSVTYTCGCFPASAQVELEDGSSKVMAELKVGDRVRVGNGEYSDVMLFSHQLERTKTEFVSVRGSGGEALLLTPSHYLYVNGVLATASTVAVGDELRTVNGTAQVTAVSREWADGLYNPHTVDGDIIVDGILTSTYTACVAPGVAHALLWPLRMLYGLGIDVSQSVYENFGAEWAKYFPQGLRRY